MTITATAPKLRRDLNPLTVGFLAFSALSPTASVYLYGAGVIHIGGTGAILALVIGGALTAWLGLMFGELAAAFPRAGGIYPAFVSLLGPRLAFPYVLLMITVAITNTGFVLLGLADYMRVLVPALPELPTAFAALAAACVIALLSVRTGAHLTTLFLGIEMAALLILSFCAFLHPWRGALGAIVHPIVAVDDHTEPLTLAGFALAIVTATFTTGGALFVLYFAEELEDAHLRIGRIVTWVSPMASLVVAVPLILAILGAPDRIAMIRSDVPLATFLDQAANPLLSGLVSAGIVIAVFNAVVALVMSYSRLIFSTARDGMFPAFAARIGRISPRWGSPVAATVALCLAVAVLMPLGERLLLVLSSNENVLEYLLTGLAVIVGRRSGRTGEHYRARPHPGLAVAGVVASLLLAVADWFDPDAGRPSLYVLVIIVAVGFVWYGRVGHHMNTAGNP